MRLYMDCFGRKVHLTDERLEHILDHTEMRLMITGIEDVLFQPQIVRRSRTDRNVFLFYNFYDSTPVGSKWLCVVVKYSSNDAFIITAYLTDKPKLGEEIWAKM